MYFGLKTTSRERTARVTRPELITLCPEMEARHQQVLLARQQPKAAANSAVRYVFIFAKS